MMKRLTPDLERIAREYMDTCVAAYAYDGLDTLAAMRQYNHSARGLSCMRPSRLDGKPVATEMRLNDADLTHVAARIDQLVRAYLQSDEYLSA